MKFSSYLFSGLFFPCPKLMNNNTDSSSSSSSSSSTSTESPTSSRPDVHPVFAPGGSGSGSGVNPSPTAGHPLPTHHRKKRSKILRIGDTSASVSKSISKPKPPGKKPQPNAPLITHPCTECGKKFWSWKALFGHMRCHPERQWRGIKPPPNLRRQGFTDNTAGPSHREVYSEEEQDVATCLLMLAGGGSSPPRTTTAPATSLPSVTVDRDYGEFVGDSSSSGAMLVHRDYDPSRAIVLHDPSRAIVLHDPGLSSSNSQFECSGCKKVFGSHQALGGHRASHKNIKGCFAITRNEGDGGEVQEGFDYNDEREKAAEEVAEGMKADQKDLGHKCSICLRVFPSGQALGGHMRCHWEKGEGSSSQQAVNNNPFTSREGFVLDLNLPAPVDSDGTSSSSSPSLSLDLNLGI